MHRYAWLIMVASIGNAQAPLPDYFPLQVGNQWVYTSGASASASRTVQIGDVTYTVLEYLYGSKTTNTEMVRSDAGKIYEYDAKSQQETVLYDFTQSVSNPSLDYQPYTISTAGPGAPLAPGLYRVNATLLDVPGGSASASVALTVVP